MVKFGKGGIKKMLVAIDGSESGLHALREAFKLAVNEKSWITVVSVVPPYEGDLDLVAVGNVQQALRRPCEKALADADAAAKEERALIKTVCEEGVPHERIIDLAEAENCELIVMGRTGRSKTERALVGSITSRVIGYGRKDVLVIPSDATVEWKSILLATDGSKYSSEATERAIDFAQAYGGALNILSIVDVPAEFYGEAPQVVEDLIKKAGTYVESARKQAEARGIGTKVFVREGDTAEVILAVAAEQNAGLTVMGSHGRTGLKRLLMGSVTEKVIGHSHCPVLVVKE